jgi:hypothetical protein
MGAKGVLQQAWFRLKDIPADQRSIRTIAKVGGLVGKVMEIDEKTRFRPNCVRVKVACRDVLKVPSSAEGTLGIQLHDFIFEREIQEGQTIKTLNSGIKITEKDHEPKRQKAGDPPKTLLLGGSSSQGGAQNNAASSSQKPTIEILSYLISNSAPPKLQDSKLKGCNE